MKNPRSPRSVVLACSLALCVLPAAFAGHEGHLKQMDANKDGKISRSEHATGAKQMFTKCDADHDGMVTATEMDAATVVKGEKPAKDDKTSVENIKLIDQNADGKLTAAEHETGYGKMFAAMDKDADGSLSKSECDEGMKTMKKGK